MEPGRSLVGVTDVGEVGYSDVLAGSYPAPERACSPLRNSLLLSCLRARRIERLEGGPSVTPRGVNAPVMALAEGPAGLESNVYVDAERSSSGSMSVSETKENRGLPLFVLGDEGANEDGRGCVYLRDKRGAVMERASGVPSWIVLLGKMKESRDCDAEARNVQWQGKLRLRCCKCNQRHTRSEEGSAGPCVAWAAKEDGGGWRSCDGDRRGGGELARGRRGMTVSESWTVLARMRSCERG